ncbi:MAG: site-specific integrase [Clostridia bacterium]|nr:site-specific integrase [Clostridia bacterium]
MNKWVGQFTAGRKADGKINRKSVYGNTRKEVKEKITKALADIQRKSFIEKNDTTIYMLGKQIIDNKFNANIITDSTYGRSLGTLKHIKNSNIANIKIQDIKVNELQEFINSKKELANSYIDKIYEMLGSVFKEAIKRDIIIKNPLTNVIKPKSSKKDKEVDALTINEQKAFIEALKNEQYKNIFLLAIHTGMRIGEILALQPTDIDFTSNLLNIDNTLTKDQKGKVIIGDTTKTYESNRKIPITIILEPILKDCLEKYMPNKNNLLFCHSNGSVIAPSTINIQFKKICKNANIRNTIKPIKRKNKNKKDIIINLRTSEVNTHMLRHTYATRCIEAGIPAPVLQKLLGHKDITVTINTYTTIFNKFKEDSLNHYINYIQNI